MNLPNALTLSRIFLVPLLVVVFAFTGRLPEAGAGRFCRLHNRSADRLSGWLPGTKTRSGDHPGQVARSNCRQAFDIGCLYFSGRAGICPRLDGGHRGRQGVRGKRSAQHRVSRGFHYRRFQAGQIENGWPGGVCQFPDTGRTLSGYVDLFNRDCSFVVGCDSSDAVHDPVFQNVLESDRREFQVPKAPLGFRRPIRILRQRRRTPGAVWGLESRTFRVGRAYGQFG